MDYKEIDTFEKVLQHNGETMEQFNNRTIVSHDTLGYEKVKSIVLAINGGVNVTEGYYPWFYNPNRSAIGFSFEDAYYGDGHIDIITNLFMIDRERAIFAGEMFLMEYSEYING